MTAAYRSTVRASSYDLKRPSNQPQAKGTRAVSESIVSVDEESLRGNIRNLVRKNVEDTTNVLLDEEASGLVGAERYGRTAGREADRSGHYKRKLVMTGGKVELRVPKLRGASFQTAVIERYRRRATSVKEAIVETCLAGVSTRRIEDVSEILWGAPVSPWHRLQPQREGVRLHRGLEGPPARWRLPLPLRR